MTTTDTSHMYRDPSASIDVRVRDLLARMTLDEKLAQLGSAWIFQLAGPAGVDAERARPLLANGIGHITRVSGASGFGATRAAAVANDIQRHLLEHTRLGIPAIVHEEICSGLMASEATVFAQAIGVASTFRPELNRRLADAIRAQMRAMGAHHGLSPVLDVCRDPRWGRLEETYGEDPYLVTQMGNAFVRGLQGVNLKLGVVATAKHFVGYGASEGGMNWAPAHLGERELRDVYLRPFEAAVREAGLASVMNAYHELDGVPCGASRWLLTDLLRGEWGFDGAVVSDYFAVNQLYDYHHVVTSKSAAAAAAITAGIDVELPSTDCYGQALRDALETGMVDIEHIDAAVVRTLAAKFELGLFDQPFVDENAVQLVTRTDADMALADAVARDSLVLLKNDGVLPLDARVASIAVVGPNAATARNMLGDYSYAAHVEALMELLRSGDNVFAMPIEHGVGMEAHEGLNHVTTVKQALVDALPDVRVRHAAGCDVTGDNRDGFDEALDIIRSSHIAVMVMGERAGLTDDCTTGESRDVSSLNLPGVQEELVLAAAATGTPIVLVLVAGRPVGSPAVHEAASAVLMAWLPGERGGVAIADALTGAFSPGGKLPVSYPRSSGQIPVFYSHKVSGGRSHWKGEYVDLSNEPLYPFGFGLSYSTFEIRVDALNDQPVASGNIVDVSATITNIGGRRADEVLQVYTHDPVASITRPVRELQGFARVTLDPGAAASVTFHVAVDALGFAGPNLSYIVEPGRVEFFVGTSSDHLQSAGALNIPHAPTAPVARVNTNDVSVSAI